MTKMFDEVLKDRVYDVVRGLSDGDFVRLYNDINDDCCDDQIYSMDDLDWLLEGKTPTEILDSVVEDFDNRKSEYIRFTGYGYIENVENFDEYYNEVVDYMIETRDPLDCDEVKEIFENAVDIWFDWIVGRFSEMFEKPISKWNQDEAENIVKDAHYYGYFEDFTTIRPSELQVAEIGSYCKKVAAAFGLWDVFENEGITSAPVLYEDSGDLYEDDEIIVFVTGRNYDNAINIINKTDHDVKIPAVYSEEIDEDDEGSYDVAPANDRIGEVAGWPSEACYAYYKNGGGVEGRKAAQEVYDGVEWF